MIEMNLSRREERCTFSGDLARLILFAIDNGYEVSIGDVFATSGHSDNSYHYRGLAADLNLFKNGEYLKNTEDHTSLGEYWKSLDSENTWGGDFQRPDGNHYSRGEGKRK